MATRVDEQSKRFRARIGGLALLGLGATLVGVGLLQTTSSHFSASCPKGTELVAKFSYDHGQYHFEAPAGNGGIVTIKNGSSKGGDAHSSIAIAATVVQSSSHSMVRTYSPAQTNLHFSNAGLPSSHGKSAAITTVQFCGISEPPNTTVPETTPVTEPVTTPETTPVTEPVTTPESTPVTTPVTDPSKTSAPDDTTVTTQPAAATTSTSVEQEAPVVTSTTLLSLGSSESALPHTGSPSMVLVLLGVALMALGLTLTVVGRAGERRTNS